MHTDEKTKQQQGLWGREQCSKHDISEKNV